MKKITTDLHKSTAALGRARRQLQELQEAKTQHRAKWVQHLNASLEAWQQQTEGFDKQQVQYNTMIQQATIELHAARNSIQQLNAKAAQDRNLESLLEESPPDNLDTSAADAAEKKLREKMQGSSFQSCKSSTASCRSGGSCGIAHTGSKTASIYRTRGWARYCYARWLNVKNGSIVSCLRKVQCGPRFSHKAVVFCDVEAYGIECCAARMPESTDFVPPSITHSIIFEDDCVFEFEAIGRAQLLHGEVLSSEVELDLYQLHSWFNDVEEQPSAGWRQAHVFDRWCPVVSSGSWIASVPDGIYTSGAIDWCLPSEPSTPLTQQLIEYLEGGDDQVLLATCIAGDGSTVLTVRTYGYFGQFHGVRDLKSAPIGNRCLTSSTIWPVLGMIL